MHDQRVARHRALDIERAGQRVSAEVRRTPLGSMPPASTDQVFTVSPGLTCSTGSIVPEKSAGTVWARSCGCEGPWRPDVRYSGKAPEPKGKADPVGIA